jgi:hypothetical protein
VNHFPECGRPSVIDTHGVCNLGGGIKKLNSVINDGQKIRVHAGEWNHILRDGKPLVIVTSWSMQLGGKVKAGRLGSMRVNGTIF